MPPRRDVRHDRHDRRYVVVDPVPFARELVAGLVESNLLSSTSRTNENDRAMEAMKAFRRLDPPKFSGESGDDLVAYHWLAEIRKLFDAVRITEDDLRVRLVACQLTGEANEWWQSTLEARKDARREARNGNHGDEQDKENLTWEEFETLFESQYFSETHREQLRYQFEDLEQGDMTVSNYATKFQTLSRFAPEMVRTEERKCRRFEKGLHESIRRLVVARRIGKFSDIVECARSIELSDTTSKGKGVCGSARQITGADSSSIRPGKQVGKRQRGQVQSRQQSPEPPTLSMTGMESSRSTVKCYKCHQLGHQVKACPLKGTYHGERPPRVCYRCCQSGHLAVECPNPTSRKSVRET